MIFLLFIFIPIIEIAIFITVGSNIGILNTIGNEDFKLYDISGKEVPIYIENLSNISTIKTQSLNQGFYLLKSAQKVFKIIIK